VTAADVPPRVTVLLAVKDGEPWVERAIASVLEQTFRDFELLVVDDGSTDGTAAIAEGTGDPRVRVIRNERNIGQVPSLNRGLREARGEYIARLDHDDWCLPTRLERQVEVLDRDASVGLVGCWLRLVDAEGRPVGAMHATLDSFVEFLYATLVMRVLVSHPAAMYRREPVLEAGGYDETTGPSEDKDLWRKLALRRIEARIVPEELVVYRLHGGQLSQTQAAYQQHIDGVSQDHFLEVLAPDVDVRPVRLLLADDPAFWRENASPEAAQVALEGLDAVLAGARTTLRLDDREVAELERLIRGRVASVARRGWRHDPRSWRRAAAAFGEPPRALLVAAPGAYAVLAAARCAARAARTLAGVVRLDRPARRSRLVRMVYSRLVGGR
jgi:glycosyltransferase involved in cell wall biosynthesis